MINCEVEFNSSWTIKDCILAEHNNKKTGIDFKITSTKHYVSVVTFYKNDNSKSLENLKQGFKRTVSWNKYKFEINNKTKKQQFVLYD